MNVETTIMIFSCIFRQWHSSTHQNLLHLLWNQCYLLVVVFSENRKQLVLFTSFHFCSTCPVFWWQQFMFVQGQHFIWCRYLFIYVLFCRRQSAALFDLLKEDFFFSKSKHWDRSLATGFYKWCASRNLGCMNIKPPIRWKKKVCLPS